MASFVVAALVVLAHMRMWWCCVLRYGFLCCGCLGGPGTSGVYPGLLWCSFLQSSTLLAAAVAVLLSKKVVTAMVVLGYPGLPWRCCFLSGDCHGGLGMPWAALAMLLS
eukprot:1152605-Pelagomonas_calceolata.AAC.1